MNQTRTLIFCLIFSNKQSKTCCIYLLVVLLGWFLNTFKVIFTQKILRVDSHNCFNFVFILIRSHSMLNCSCPWGGSPFNHDQALMWSLLHYHGGNVVSRQKPLFRPSISWCLWNTFVLHQFGVVTEGGCETLIDAFPIPWGTQMWVQIKNRGRLVRSRGFDYRPFFWP
jgi:hypothetical protein